MKNTENRHTFHIPVMGTGFSIDTPVKVAKYGISSVISVVDDLLVENMREYYSEKTDIPFKAISNKIEDFRAKRFTEYLNLVDEIVTSKFEELKNSYHKNIDEIHKYLDLLPDSISLKNDFNKLIENNEYAKKVHTWLNENLYCGSIDVNIMTKLDRVNYQNNEELPTEYNDAHASLRGFAESTLESSLILSAGLNPRLYGYLEKFEDFFPDENGYIKKKVVLKVSDYRSALIQGKFLAKKGIWVSEYRIESGLNCGGHAFATDGFLMGPILEEFKNKKDELIETVFNILSGALAKKDKPCPTEPINLLVTAQGGIGTNEEHNFLINYYNLDSIGWATPFLLVPEATNVDETTLELLCNAEEKDLYLSHISPLGIPFNAVKGNTQELEKLKMAKKGRPGSSCPKKHLVFNNEFTDKNICTASRQFQHLKLKQLESQELSFEEKTRKETQIMAKECLCVGLSNSTQHIHNIENKYAIEGTSVCPGPNLAYYSEITSLKDMVGHIYGKIDIIKVKNRPNLFIKELNLYLDYLKSQIEEMESPLTDKQLNYITKFQNNLTDGINYYKDLFSNFVNKFEDVKEDAIAELNNAEIILQKLVLSRQTVEAE